MTVTTHRARRPTQNYVAEFDKRLSERDEEYEYVPQMQDSLNYLMKRGNADLISGDLRLEERRRPELTTRSFITNYFKTLRLKNMNILRIDEGLVRLRHSGAEP